MINLKDCTFLIPTFIDCDDRIKNLILTVKILTEAFKTNVYIGEQKNLGSDAYEHVKDLNITYYSFDVPCNYFNRQAIFNKLAIESKTKCIVIHDTDVTFLPQQIITAYNQIMEDKFDMVYPYEGNFYQVDKNYRDSIKKIDDLNDVDLTKCKLLNMESFGGSVFFNRKSFIDGGMENENFKGWGCEDWERRDRFDILGFKQCRITGPLYHFYHDRGKPLFYIPNSNEINAKEHIRIMGMNKEQLLLEISKWDWVKNAKENSI